MFNSYCALLCLKMLRKYKLTSNRNSKIVFENHYTFVQISAWLIASKTCSPKNNVKNNAVREKLYKMHEKKLCTHSLLSGPSITLRVLNIAFGALCAGLWFLTNDPVLCHQLTRDNLVSLYRKLRRGNPSQNTMQRYYFASRSQNHVLSLSRLFS